jgi:transcriptional regulator with XRE-family HTH domain
VGVSAERAQRVRQIREAMGLTQPEFAARLNAAAAELGLDPDYTQLNVSQRETDRLTLDIEDYLILTRVDPHRRPLVWLALGRDEGGAGANDHRIPGVPRAPIRRDLEGEAPTTVKPSALKKAASGGRKRR